MRIIADLRKSLAAVGATLDPDTAQTLNCDAPSGYVWSANGGTCISIPFKTRGSSWLVEALRKDGIPRLSKGLDKVTDPDDIAQRRFDLGDDSWGAASNAPERIEWV